ncbi:MAG TPA: EAL domain-containing protein [Spirochaetota bacterium]|nr:EAL domain-containing protein [Spirochaetota bacterium]
MQMRDLHFLGYEITTHYHPIVSIKTSKVIGYEALVRGIDACGGIVSPDVLLSCAMKDGQLLEFDRMCRESAVRNYPELCTQTGGNPFLFMNFESSLIDMGVTGSGVIMNLCADAGVDPSRVVIEIVESRVNDVDAMSRFIGAHRDKGFCIALDDVGEGYSNLNRISVVNPDIMKIDRSLVTGISHDYVKQRIVSSLAHLARGIGALVCAEGIECAEDALSALEAGADLFQGFHFAKPAPVDRIADINSRIDDLSHLSRSHAVSMIEKKRDMSRRHQRDLEDASNRLEEVPFLEFQPVIERCLSSMSGCECVYVLNSNGCQITETICMNEKSGKSASLFHPAEIGTDHSLKDYFYIPAESGGESFNSDAYVSLASGNLCRTVSKTFAHRETGESYVLCADFLVKPE